MRPSGLKIGLEGQGVPRNYAEALKWFRKAADMYYFEAPLRRRAVSDSGRRRVARHPVVRHRSC